ncbi:MAG: hypothetical protein R3E93_09180 [Thiothrix sp.]
MADWADFTVGAGDRPFAILVFQIQRDHAKVVTPETGHHRRNAVDLAGLVVGIGDVGVGFAIIQQDVVGVLRPCLLDQGGCTFQADGLIFRRFEVVTGQDIGI